MGARGTTFGKLERERAKKAKAAAKRERRLERGSDTPTDEDEAGALESEADDDLGELSAADLLDLVEKTHQKFEAGMISLDEFEEKKAQLLARLPID